MATQRNENDSAPLNTDNCNQNEINERTAVLRPTRNSTARRRRIFVTLCILVTELCERLTFYGVTANLVLFCVEDLKLDSPWPSVTNYLFQGTCYLIPLIGGWLADAYLGRYNTIYGSSLLYVAGTIVLMGVSFKGTETLKAWPDFPHSHALRRFYFVFALVMIAFGTGGIKANVSPFGADQVEQEGPRAVQTFFNWFYWFINVGSLISFTVVVYVQEYGLFYGYLITTGTMFLATITFVLGRNKYLTKPPGGSQLSETVKIIHNAIKNHHSSDTEMWLDKAKTCFGGKYTDRQVEDVKLLLKVIPVFLLFIVYWIIYSQVGCYAVVLSALHMHSRHSQNVKK